MPDAFPAVTAEYNADAQPFNFPSRGTLSSKSRHRKLTGIACPQSSQCRQEPNARATFLMTAAVCRMSHQYMRTKHWAARYNTSTWLLIKLKPKAVVFSSLCHCLFLVHKAAPQGACCHAGTWQQGRQQWMVSAHKPWPVTWSSRACGLAMAAPSCPCWSLLWPTRYATTLLTCNRGSSNCLCIMTMFLDLLLVGVGSHALLCSDVHYDGAAGLLPAHVDDTCVHHTLL